MARHTKAVCRLCRREGEKLFLKGRRCDTARCSITNPYRHGRRSEYGMQLREKQKVKRFYGIGEKQFRRFFNMAEKQKGNTGENLLILFERRLDNVVHLLRLGLSRSHARQLITHGHIKVNGRKCDIPSRLVKQGDRIEIKGENMQKAIKENFEIARARGTPGWLNLDEEKMTGLVNQTPAREDVSIVAEEQLIVEFS
jgi:small subunit ribosomal protein S4